MKPQISEDFDQHYQTHRKRLKLNGLQPKTIDTYSHACVLQQRGWLGLKKVMPTKA
jgi:hypothetical protein